MKERSLAKKMKMSLIVAAFATYAAGCPVPTEEHETTARPVEVSAQELDPKLTRIDDRVEIRAGCV